MLSSPPAHRLVLAQDSSARNRLGRQFEMLQEILPPWRLLVPDLPLEQLTLLHLLYGLLILPDLSQARSEKEVRKRECRIQVDRVLELLN